MARQWDNAPILSESNAQEGRNSQNWNAQFQVPQDPKKLITWLENKRKRGHKRMPDLQMKMNFAYLLGHQWIVWDRDRRQFRRPQWRPNDPNAPIRVTVNKIGSIVERQIARLLKEKPEPQCRPVSDDEDAIGAAQVGTRILDHELYRLHWDTALQDLYFWAATCGWGYLFITWDPDDGNYLGTFQGDDDDDVEQVYDGNIVLDVVAPFEVSVDPNAYKFEQARWCVRTLSMTPEAVWERWGQVPVGATEKPGRTLVDEVYSLTDKARQDRPYVETIPVHQMWFRPGTRAAPDGLVVTWAGNTILDPPRPFPYKHGKLPFVQFDLLPGLGTREGRTWVTDLIPIQADYNDSRSREASIRRVMTPKIIAAHGQIDPQRITSRVEVITYAPSGPQPQYMMPDGRWMAQFQQNMNRAKAEMEERAGQGPASMGNAPASMPSASVMALQDADDTAMSISAKCLAQGIQESGKMILQLVRQFWDEPRTVRTWSEESDLEVYQFSGSDIEGDVDVHVDSESSLPKSKSARVQLMMTLMNTPIGQQMDPQDILRIIDLPALDFVFHELNIDIRQQDRETSRMLEGHYQMVHDWDDHNKHLFSINKFRKSEDYEKLDPEIQGLIDGHAHTHQEMLMAQQTQPGNPGPPPLGASPAASNPQPQLAQEGAPAGLGGGMGGDVPPTDEQAIRHMAGIGGPAEPGAVPGVEADTQASRMGG